MAYSNAEIVKFLIDNPQLTDAQLADIMDAAGVDVSQVAEATQSKVEDIQARFETKADEVYVPPPVAEPATTYEEPAAPVAPPLAEPVAATVSAPITSLLDIPKVLSPDEPPAAPVVQTVAAPIAPIKEAAPTAPVAKTGTQQVVDLLVKNPSITDAEIAKAMETYKVSPADLAKATVSDEGKIAARVAATLPANQAVLLGDTYVQAVNESTGSGMDEQIGGVKNVITYKADENKAGGGFTQYTPTGELESKGVQKEVASFTGGLVDMLKDPVVQAALLGVAGGAGAFDGLLGGAGGATAGATGTAGMTAAELAQLDLALGGAGGTAGAETLAAALTTGAPTATLTNLTGGGGGATTVAPTGVDYSLTSSTPTTPTTNMGGAQGLQGGTSANLPTMGGGQGITLNVGAPSTTLADAIATIGGVGPTNLTTMGGGQGLTLQTPTGLVTSTGTIPIGGLTGNTSVIGATGINTATNIGSGIGSTIPLNPLTPPRVPVVPTTPVTPPVTPTPPPVTPTPPVVPPTTPLIPPTLAEVIKTIAPVVVPALVATAVTPKTPTKTGYDIVPVPTDWKPPTAQPTTPFQPLAPIDFGTSALLKGTQFERLLDPNYGKVPAPTQYSQPSNLSYDDLMSILGSKQGMPPTSSLSINDVISGIQNQYGQVPVGAVGAKPA
jgi:hypothetical protein